MSDNLLKSEFPVITTKNSIFGIGNLSVELANCPRNCSNLFFNRNIFFRVISTGECPISFFPLYQRSPLLVIGSPFQCFNSIINTLQWVTITKSNSPSLRSFISAKRKPEYPFQGKMDFKDFNASNPCPFTFLLFSEA